MAGLVLARGLVGRGMRPLLLERAPRGTRIEGPIRAAGRDIPPLRNGSPVAIAVGREQVVRILREGVDVRRGQEVVDLTRDGGRVTGVRVRGPEGTRDVGADLVVAADGSGSRVRELAGVRAKTRLSDTAFLSFRSPAPAAEPFRIAFLSDGRQVTLLGWPGGSAGSWQIDRVPGGAEAAPAPGLDAFRRGFARLLPAAAEPLTAPTSIDQVRYREVVEVRCETWWAPGVALVGEALHAMNPEVGIGSGPGMGDAQAPAVAIGRNPGDPDAACRDYEHWRRPAVAPYLAVGAQASKFVTGGEPRPDERWPPPGA